MKVKIKITETLERVVCVEAQDKNEGIVKVVNDYKNGKIVLDADDFVGFTIEKCEEERTEN